MQCVSLTLGLLLVLPCFYTDVLAAPPALEDKKGYRVSDSLKFIVVVSRHGNRGLTDYPYDPYPIDDPYYWPYGAKQLTPVGRQQLFTLGEQVRELYNGFLNRDYYAEELYATSTDTDRTLMSGESFLAGLYRPHGFQVWNWDVLWQPASIRSTSPDHTEDVLTCPKFVKGVEEIIQKFLESYGTEISKLIAYVNEKTGLNVTGLAAAKDLYHLGDKLSTEEFEGYALPYWTKKFYPNPLHHLVGKIYLNLYAGTDANAGLMMGAVLKDILTAMAGKIDGSLSDQRRIHYYSAYDGSIVALQVALGIPRNEVVDLVNPGSALILELHQDPVTQQVSVQPLIVQGSTEEIDIDFLDIPNCGTPCDFNTLVNNTKRFTEVDFEAECGTSSLTRSNTKTDLFDIFDQI